MKKSKVIVRIMVVVITLVLITSVNTVAKSPANLTIDEATHFHEPFILELLSVEYLEIAEVPFSFREYLLSDGSIIEVGSIVEQVFAFGAPSEQNDIDFNLFDAALKSILEARDIERMGEYPDGIHVQRFSTSEDVLIGPHHVGTTGPVVGSGSGHHFNQTLAPSMRVQTDLSFNFNVNANVVLGPSMTLSSGNIRVLVINSGGQTATLSAAQTSWVNNTGITGVSVGFPWGVAVTVGQTTNTQTARSPQFDNATVLTWRWHSNFTASWAPVTSALTRELARIDFTGQAGFRNGTVIDVHSAGGSSQVRIW